MKRTLVFYSHRLTHVEADVQASNLDCARRRMRALQLRADAEGTGELYYAPWMDLDEAGVGLRRVWTCIAAEIAASDHVHIDGDGAPLSRGQNLEMRMAQEMGVPYTLGDEDLDKWLAIVDLDEEHEEMQKERAENLVEKVKGEQR